MSYRQPPPSPRRLALLERRPRRQGDINWREVAATISWAGAAWLPLAVVARFSLGAFDGTPLAWVPESGPVSQTLAVFGAAGVGYLAFRVIGGLLIVVTWLVFFVSRTPVRQDWIAGFLAGGTAVIVTLPLVAARRIDPLGFALGPLLAILIAQPPTTLVATRELKRFVRGAWWSAEDQLLVDRKSLNLQISIAALLGLTAVLSLAMGLMRLSGLLDLPAGRSILAGISLEVAMLPASVWLAHRLLGGQKVVHQPESKPPKEAPSQHTSPW